MTTDLAVLAQHVIDGHAEEVSRMTRAALDEGRSPADVLERGLIAGMRVVGVRFRENVIFVPEVLVAARAMKAGMTLLEPILAASGVEPVGTFVLGTVRGDIHDIGKNLVGMMLRGAGFRVVDLGVNVPAEKFVDAVREHRAEVMGMSALLTTTMGQMKVVLEALRKARPPGGCRVMVGGAAVSEDWAMGVGAHGYGKDAPAAVARALELLDEVKAARGASTDRP